MSYFDKLSSKNPYYLSVACGKTCKDIGFVTSMSKVRAHAIAYGIMKGSNKVTVMLGNNIMDDLVDIKEYEIEYSLKEITK